MSLLAAEAISDTIPIISLFPVINIIFDHDTLTPMFSYTDEQGNQHEVWFENSESIIAKLRLAWQQGISGVALWRLGMEDPGVWPRIASEIVVRRAIY